MQLTKHFHTIELTPQTQTQLVARMRKTLKIDPATNTSDGWLLGNATPIEMEWLIRVPTGKQGKPGFFRDKPRGIRVAYNSSMRALKKRIAKKLQTVRFTNDPQV